MTRPFAQDRVGHLPLAVVVRVGAFGVVQVEIAALSLPQVTLLSEMTRYSKGTPSSVVSVTSARIFCCRSLLRR